MKITIIVHVFPPEHAPAGVMVQELAQDLVKAGHSVTILTGWPNHPKGVLFDGWNSQFRDIKIDNDIRLIRCGHSIRPTGSISARIWYYFTFAISTFINGLREKRPDVVFCLSTPIFGSSSARLLAWIKRAKFVYGIYDLHPESALHAGMLTEQSIIYRLWKWQDSILCRHSHAILTLSKQLKDAVCRREVPEKRVEVIPLWIDSIRIEPGNRINPWRNKQNISDNTFVALYAGTIGYISGVGILAETAKRLQERNDIIILCVGEGPAKESLMETCNLEKINNIKFLPFQAEADLADMQATADAGLVTLLPDAGETSVPSKVLGYMAAGRPVIASVADNSATAQILSDAHCGLVSQPGNARLLAESITTLADNFDLRDKLGSAARKYTLSKFSRDKNTNLYEKLFRSLSCEN